MFPRCLFSIIKFLVTHKVTLGTVPSIAAMFFYGIYSQGIKEYPEAVVKVSSALKIAEASGKLKHGLSAFESLTLEGFSSKATPSKVLENIFKDSKLF